MLCISLWYVFFGADIGKKSFYFGIGHKIAPTYLRMPQAERERLERLAQENN